jgi:type I restriction enzyme S subunit
VTYVDKEFHNRIYPRCNPKLGDVLLTKDGAGTGNVALNTIAEPFSLLSSVCLIKPNPVHLDSAFLCYYLQSPKGRTGVTGEMTGAAIRRIILRQIKLARIPLPPLPEQRRIVVLLDKAFEGIGTAKVNAESSVEWARALRERALQSMLGAQGAGWERQRLGELVEFRNGINFTRSSRGEPVSVVGVKDFRGNSVAPEDGLDTVVIEGDLSEADMLKEDDLVFVRSNGSADLIGRCLLVRRVAPRTAHSGFTIRARLVNSAVLPTYLLRFMRSEPTRRAMIESGIGTNIKSLSQATLASLVVPLPSRRKQAEMVARCEHIESSAQDLESVQNRKIEALDRLKDSLLQRAFSGLL